ncbi:hypothetical protein ACN469_27820 [Corallococcus terminator]
MSRETNERQLAPLSHVVHVEIGRAGDELSVSMRIQAVDDQTDRTLVFRGVRSLRFLGQVVELTGLVLMQAEDISSRGWEGLHFHVKDYEDEFISFDCRSIDS